MLAHLYGKPGKWYLDVTDMEGRTIILIDVKNKREARKICKVYNYKEWNF